MQELVSCLLELDLFEDVITVVMAYAVQEHVYSVPGKSWGVRAKKAVLSVYDPSTDTWADDEPLPCKPVGCLSIRNSIAVWNESGAHIATHLHIRHDTGVWQRRRTLLGDWTGFYDLDANHMIMHYLSWADSTLTLVAVTDVSTSSYASSDAASSSPAVHSPLTAVQQLPPSPVKRMLVPLAALGGDFYCTESGKKTVFRWSPSQQPEAWTSVAPLSVCRSHGSRCIALQSNDQLLVTGGTTITARSIASCEVYDRVANVWKRVADMSTPRASHGIARVDGHVYVIGGYSLLPSAPTSSVEMYDEVNDRWTLKAPIRHPDLYACTVCAEY